MVYVPGTENDDNLVIRGGSASETNFSEGRGGNDTITGSQFKDKVFGGQGNDTLRGNEGADELWGENGNDRIIGGGNGDQTIDELLFGGNGDDVIYGDFVVERPNQNGGRDELAGGEGNDRLYGGQGNDNLMGGNGDDKLYGGSGDDFLRGQSGDDLFQGGTGNDTFWFESPSTEDGRDVITDFTAGEDIIRLSGDYDDVVIFEYNTSTFMYSNAAASSGNWMLEIENANYADVMNSLFVLDGGQESLYMDIIG